NSPGGAVRFEFKTDKKKDDGAEKKREKIKDKDEDTDKDEKIRKDLKDSNEQLKRLLNRTSVNALPAAQTIGNAITATVNAMSPARLTVTGSTTATATRPAVSTTTVNTIGT